MSLRYLNKTKRYVRALYPVILLILTVSLYLAGQEAASFALSNTGEAILNKAPSSVASSLRGFRLAAPEKFVQPRHVGDARVFTLDTKRHQKRTFDARLRASGTHTDIWVDNKEQISDETLSRLLSRFDEKIYPSTVEYFAGPSTLEQIARINILITDISPSGGYFDAGDIRGGNRLHLIYLDADVARNRSAEAYNTLAHEFAHLLYYVGGGADIAWLDEGLAVYAEYLNGSYPHYFVRNFRKNPDVTLIKSFSGESRHYGAAFLLVFSAAEKVEQSGNSIPEFIKSLIKNSAYGKRGIDTTLHRFIRDKNNNSVEEIYHPLTSRIEGYTPIKR